MLWLIGVIKEGYIRFRYWACNYDANIAIYIHLSLEAFKMQNKLVWHTTISVCTHKDLGTFWVLTVLGFNYFLCVRGQKDKQ